MCVPMTMLLWLALSRSLVLSMRDEWVIPAAYPSKLTNDKPQSTDLPPLPRVASPEMLVGGGAFFIIGLWMFLVQLAAPIDRTGRWENDEQEKTPKSSCFMPMLWCVFCVALIAMALLSASCMWTLEAHDGRAIAMARDSVPEWPLSFSGFTLAAENVLHMGHSWVSTVDDLQINVHNLSLRLANGSLHHHVCVTGNAAEAAVDMLLVTSGAQRVALTLGSAVSPVACVVQEARIGKTLFSISNGVKDECAALWRGQSATCDLRLHAQNSSDCWDIFKIRLMDDECDRPLLVVSDLGDGQECFREAMREFREGLPGGVEQECSTNVIWIGSGWPTWPNSMAAAISSELDQLEANIGVSPQVLEDISMS